MGIKFIKKANESFESDLENIAQTSGEIDYGDAWKLNGAAAKDPEFRKKVRNLIGDWRSAAEDEDDDEMTKAAKALKALADPLPKQEGYMHPDRCKTCGRGPANENRLMSTTVPYEFDDIKAFMKASGFTCYINPTSNYFEFKRGNTAVSGNVVPWCAYVISHANKLYFGRSLKNWEDDMKAIGIK